MANCGEGDDEKNKSTAGLRVSMSHGERASKPRVTKLMRSALSCCLSKHGFERLQRVCFLQTPKRFVYTTGVCNYACHMATFGTLAPSKTGGRQSAFQLHVSIVKSNGGGGISMPVMAMAFLN